MMQGDMADMVNDDTPAPKVKQGFAALSKARVQEISSSGGKAAHAKGTAHKFTKEEAQAAGRKGGQAAHARRRAKLEAQ